MSEIIVRKGPDMNFIIPEHRLAFEQKVIDCYEKSLGILGKHHQYKLPHVDLDMFDYLMFSQSIHYISGMMNYKQPDEHFYDHYLKDLSFQEQVDFAQEQWKTLTYEGSQIRMVSDEMFYHDIVAVLNFYNIAFVDLGTANEWGHWVSGHFYKNLPFGLRQVW